MQLFSVSTMTVSSVVLAGSASSHAQLSSAQLMNLPAIPYVLRAGETPASVAAAQGLTLAQLKAFNQLRAFRAPFEQLTAGDEIDVPDLARVWQLTPSFRDIPGQANDEPATRLAGNLQAAGGMLQNTRNSDAAAGMARSMASGAANDAVSQWLNKFGTARANISIDEHGSLDNSSVDWLLPVYDSPENVLFTQLGARNKDHRTTLNAGWGLRHFTSGWMYGFNNFFDNDITGNNRRIGLGLEARTDYLQFAANSYLRLNDWHQSRDFDDYDERPANGYDLRARGWLPALPQLGGKLVYEQYQGDNVALFGKDNLQRNPYAVTAGVEWTPFPLLTVGVDERMGKGGQDETSVNLQVTWRPGDSLSSQLSADSVAASRLLSGSRYDLVERNNDIVLEYRKQELIALSLNTGSITGPSGSTWPLSATVNTKYTLQSVSVSADSFIAAGGTVQTLDLQHFSLTLPPYQNVQHAQAARKQTGAPGTAGDTNVYLLSVVAGDDRGNTSSAQTVTVTVLPPQLSLGQPVITGDHAPADGTSTIRVGIVADDGAGHPVPAQQVKFVVRHADGSTETLTGVTDDNGFVSVDISSTVPGDTTVTISAGDASRDTVIHFVAGNLSAANSTLTASPATIVADGSTPSDITLTLHDVNNNPVSGQTVVFASSLAGTTVGAVTDNGNGTYTAQLTGTAAGSTSVTATVGGSAFGVSAAQVTLTADSSTAGLGNSGAGLTTESDNAVANGSAVNSVKAVVTDAHGNPVDGAVVSFAADNGATVVPSGTTGADGSVTVTLTSLTAGLSTVTATVNGTTATVDTHFGARLSTANSTLTASPAAIVADGRTTTLITLTLHDVNNNPVSGQTVVFASSLAGTTVGAVTDNGNGTYTAQLTGTATGTTSVTATVGGSAFGVTAAQVALTVDRSTAGLDNPGAGLFIVSDNAVANGTATNSVKAIVTDVHGHPIERAVVSFTADNGASLSSSSGTTGADGSVTVTLTSTTTGLSTVTASIYGSTATTATHFVADGGNLSAANSTLTASPATIVADGSTPSDITLTLHDVNNNPVSGQTVVFASSLAGTTVGAVTDNGNGTYTAQLTGTAAGSTSVTATVGGSAFGVSAAQVTLTADSSTAGLDNPGAGLSRLMDGAVADGTATNSVKATVTDAHGNPVSGQSVSFAADNGAMVTASGTTGADGSVTVTLTSLTSGLSTVTATVNGNSQTVMVFFVADSSTAGLGNPGAGLTTESDNAVANGSAVNSVKAVVTDAHGNPVDGAVVSFAADNGAMVTASGTAGADGSVIVYLTSTTTGLSTVTASINGSTATTATHFVANGGNLSAANSSLTGSPATIVADGSTPSAITLTLHDVNNNPVSGQTVVFASSLAGTTVGAVTDNGNGTYTAQLTGTAAGTTSVTATVGGSAFGVSAAQVTLTADRSTARLDNPGAGLSIVSDNAVADRIATNSVKATVTDAHGNPVEGVQVMFSITNADGPASGITGADGSVTVSNTGRMAGLSTVTATEMVNGTTATVDTHFVADSSSAMFSGTPAVTGDNAVANGSDKVGVDFTVTDAVGNPLAGQSVTITTGNGSAPGTVTVVTDGNGIAHVDVTNTTAGPADVTASVNGNSQTATVHFVADSSTARLDNPGAGLSIHTDNAPAGVGFNVVDAIVTDAHGNTVDGAVVSFTADNGSVISTSSPTGIIFPGLTFVTLSNQTAGLSTVTASINGSTATIATHFVADGGNLSAANSTLTASPATIVADGSTPSAITLTLHDVNNNPVSGQTVVFASSLAGTTVGAVTDHSNGTYTAQLTGTAAGSTSVTATVGGSAFGVTAAQVTLTEPPPQPVPVATTLDVNGYAFAADSGFPQTGFTGAKFQILLNGNANSNNSYVWSADQSWVSVDSNANVSFTGTATSGTKNVTITARPKAGGAPLTYSFTVSKWFTNNGSTTMSWANASSYCSTRGGLPAVLDLTAGAGTRGITGSLWSEWGRMSMYSGSGFLTYRYWVLDKDDYYYYISSSDGSVDESDGNGNYAVLCRQGL